jgi:hypothetical protein
MQTNKYDFLALVVKKLIHLSEDCYWKPTTYLV